MIVPPEPSCELAATTTFTFGCVLAVEEKSATFTNPPETVVADASASVIPVAWTSMLPLVTIVELLPPTVVVTVGFDSASAVLPVVILIRPPPLVSRLLDVTALPSASTESLARAGASARREDVAEHVRGRAPALGRARLRRIGRIGAGRRRGRVRDADVDDAARRALHAGVGDVGRPGDDLDHAVQAVRGERAQRRGRGDRRVDVRAGDRVDVRVADRDRAAALDVGAWRARPWSGRSASVGYGKLWSALIVMSPPVDVITAAGRDGRADGRAVHRVTSTISDRDEERDGEGAAVRAGGGRHVRTARGCRRSR